uniref:Alpha-centractin (Trinotate prediction) n=1 Tax=Henneguya salminicola TaxID=69463 RepID=A0A6G3MFT1_HENSL
MIEHLFEVLSVPAICLANSSVLSLYGNGFHTGCVLDSGAGVTSAISVCEGYSLTHSSQRINIAGNSVSDFLQKNLFREGHYFSPKFSSHTLNELKHNVCQITPIPYNIDSISDYSASVPYTLPDGSIINIGRSRIISTEVLFRPFIIGDESPAIHQLIYDSIKLADPEVRKKLYSNIVLSGGNTLFQGTQDRLLYEMKLLTGNQCNLKIYSSKRRITSAFKGL